MNAEVRQPVVHNRAYIIVISGCMLILLSHSYAIQDLNLLRRILNSLWDNSYRWWRNSLSHDSC